MLAVLFGGACAGLAGAYLPLAYTPFFVPGMTAGRGWIALALVVFASWLPGRLMIGAYLFGAVTILQLHAQGWGVGVPSQLMSAMPYLATVIVLVLISRARTGGSTAPAALGTVFVPGPLNMSKRTRRGAAHSGENVPPVSKSEKAYEKEMDRSDRIAVLASGSGLFGASAADKLKIGFVYLGPVGDFGWTYQHDIGRLDDGQGVRRQGRNHLSRERQRRPGLRALDRAAGARRQQADLHDLVRLHGADAEGRQEISRT